MWDYLGLFNNLVKCQVAYTYTPNRTTRILLLIIRKNFIHKMICIVDNMNLLVHIYMYALCIYRLVLEVMYTFTKILIAWG